MSCGRPAQSTIAVLEGVDLEEHHHPDADQQQGVQSPGAALVVEPGHQFGHEPRRVERGGGLEHHADLIAVRIERDDAVGRRLVVAAMPGVFVAVDEQVAMELLDVVLGQGDLRPRREHQLHHGGIAGPLLLVAGGRPDALDGGHPAQRDESVRGECAQRVCGRRDESALLQPV